MSILDDFIVIASVGTSRKAPPLPPPDGMLGDVFQLVSNKSPEEKLLVAVAIASQYEACGRLPGRDTAALEPAAEETRPPCTRRAGELLAQILAFPNTTTKEHLVDEWLECAVRTKRRVPHRLLPVLLEYGAACRSARQAIAEVSGARGAWLIRLNPRWHFTVAEQEDPRALWTTGTHDQRIATVSRVRASDPPAARQMISSTWGEDAADDRAAFVSAMITSLSGDDEQFLESALDDRSKQVRAASAELLSRLPNSAYVRRMIQRAEPLVRIQAGRGKKAAAIEITLPDEQFDPAWARDGIAEKPQGGVGRRQGWLAQIVASIPPSHWSGSWSLRPADCVAAVTGEFADVLLTAWHRAAARHPDPHWISALLRASTHDDRGPLTLDLLNALSPEDQQTLTAEILESRRTNLESIGHLLRAIRFPLGYPCARALFKRLASPSEPQSGGYYYLLGTILRELAVRVPPEFHDELAWRWTGADWEANRKALDELLQILLIRRDLRREFES